jgi:hypothetical protein
MIQTFFALALAGGLFLGMLLLQEVGRRIGVRRRAQDPDGASTGLGTIETAVFALLGLLIAFTFSGAASRFDGRRQLVAQEANAIGTAYLRLDMLAPDARSALRPHFGQYLDSRLAVYRKLPDIVAAEQEWARGVALQGEIWTQAVAACRAQSDSPPCLLLLPALNQMIDITTTRKMSTMTHPPSIIFVLLFGLALGCSLVAGYGMAGSKQRSWIHMIVFAAMMAVTVFVIIDIEYPRVGLIRVEAADQVLVELRESMR